MSAEPPRPNADAPPQANVDPLLQALQEGDEAALTRLLPLLRGRLTRVAKRRVSEAHVEEIVQETLTILWQKRGAIRDEEHLLHFTFQVLRNLIGNLYLRDRRHGHETETGLGLLASDWGDPEDSARSRELAGFLERAIAKCAAENEIWGRILTLLHEGRSAAEISREFGNLSAASLYRRVYRARQRLREILADDYQVEP